jgi:flagellar assembly factor FliW
MPTESDLPPSARDSQQSHSIEVLRFGRQEPLEVTAGEVLTFPHGLVGMEHLRQFVVVEDPRVYPCRWLQSLQDPALAFLIVEPVVIAADYRLDLPDQDRRDLALDASASAEPSPATASGESPAFDVWVIVTVRPQPEQSTANLLAPVVVNRERRLGKQVVMHESGYSLRHPLAAPDAPGQNPAVAAPAPREDGRADPPA